MAKTIVFEVEVDDKGAVKSLNNIDKEVKDIDNSVKDTAKSTKAMGSSFVNAVPGLNKLKAGFQALNSAAGIIGLIVAGLFALKSAFTTSEEGQNQWNKVVAISETLLGNVVDLIADLAEGLVNVFSDPVESLKSFGNLIKENLQNRFEGLTELIPQLSKAINLLFKGEFAEAGRVATNAVAKVGLGVENIVEKTQAAIDKTKEFIQGQEDEIKATARVADMRAKADKLERKLIVDRSILESKIANLRLKARQEDEFSAEERKAALIEAQGLENELLDLETQALELRRDAKILENTFSRSNKENLDAEAQAIAAVNNQQAQRANVARQLQRELNTINGQIAAEAKALAEEEKRLAAERQKVIDEGRAAEAKYQAEQKAKADAKLAEDKARAQEELATFTSLSNAKQQLALGGLQLAKLVAVEGSKFGKALAVSEAGIQTTGAVINAFKTAQLSPITLVNPAYPYLTAAAAGAFGLANIAKILSAQTVSPSGSVSSPSSPVALAPPPNFTTPDTGINQLGQTITEGINSRPVKAYVVGQDITTQQQLDRATLNNTIL